MEGKKERLSFESTLLNPVRLKILKELCKKPNHIAGLSRELDMERRHLSYHLGVIEESGITKSKAEIGQKGLQKGKGMRIISVESKQLKPAIENLIEELQEMLQNIKK